MSTLSEGRRQRMSIGDLCIYLALTVIAIICIFPLVHNLSVSLSSQGPANSGLVTFFPQEFTLDSYRRIMSDKAFFQAFWISCKRVFFVVIMAFLVSVMFAFPLSRSTKQFKLRNVYTWLLVFVMIFNAGLIPFYIAMRSIKLTNNFWGLVLPMVVNVFNIILIMNYYRNLPKELDESASMDGAGPWRLLFQIYVPLSVPVLATITLFNMVNTWNEYFLGLVMVQNQNDVPLQTYIQAIVVQIDPTRATQDLSIFERISNKTLNAAKIMVTMLPIMCVYPFLQRYFITGITLGSVKE